MQRVRVSWRRGAIMIAALYSRNQVIWARISCDRALLVSGKRARIDRRASREWPNSSFRALHIPRLRRHAAFLC